jgi:hypothetical protein
MCPKLVIVGVGLAVLLAYYIYKETKKGLKESYITVTPEMALVKVLPGYRLGIPTDEQTNLLSAKFKIFPEYEPTWTESYAQTFGITPPVYENGKPFHRKGLVLSQVPQPLYDYDREDEMVKLA